MPIVTIQVTREGVTPLQKTELIEGATALLVRVLHKEPASTFVLIEEIDTDNWGLGGLPVTALRRLPRPVLAPPAGGRRDRP